MAIKPLVVGLTVVAGMLAGVCPRAGAEVFQLANGGRVEGEWLNRDEPERQNYEIRLPSGGKMILANAQVKQVVAARPEEQEYQKIRPQYADTPAEQWKLAEWCEEHHLSAQRTAHLRRVIELDPNHVDARHALGYSQVDGQWMTQDEAMMKQGLRRYKGRWRTAQEIELIEGKRKQELAAKDWYQKLKLWRGWLGGNKDQQARDSITGISAPAAVGALASALKEDTQPPARLLYIEALDKIGDLTAVGVLAKQSLEDPVEEVRLTCLDHLEKAKHPEVVSYYVSQLKSKDNRMVNRAAIGLSRMNDPSSIGPLIDALITTHKFKVTTGGGGPGSMTTTFSKNPGGGGSPGGMGGVGMGMGGGGPKIISQQISNQAVLDALATLTKQNFGFDLRRWHAWYNAQQKSDVLGSRRD